MNTSVLKPMSLLVQCSPWFICLPRFVARTEAALTSGRIRCVGLIGSRAIRFSALNCKANEFSWLFHKYAKYSRVCELFDNFYSITSIRVYSTERKALVLRGSCPHCCVIQSARNEGFPLFESFIFETTEHIPKILLARLQIALSLRLIFCFCAVLFDFTLTVTRS